METNSTKSESICMCKHHKLVFYNFFRCLGSFWMAISLCIMSYYCQSDVDRSLYTLGNTSLPLDSPPVNLIGEEADALRGKYIRRLTAVLAHHIPAFWKVGLSVFSGKFAKVFWTLSSFSDNILYIWTFLY